MKIERRDYAVLMAHSGIAVFFNRYKRKENPTEHYFLLRVNKGLHNDKGKIDKWITLGEMEIEPLELNEFLKLLGELAR